MISFLEKNEKRIILFTYVFIFIMFCFFSLMDLRKNISDYQFFAGKINETIQNFYKSEIHYLNLRITNYIDSVAADRDVATLLERNDRDGLREVFQPLSSDFRNRSIPLICLMVFDAEGNVLYESNNHSSGKTTEIRRSSTLESVLKTREPAYGFEFHGTPLHYSISLPITAGQGGRFAGAIEIELDPAWFHFKLGWFLRNIKTAIVRNDKTLSEDVYGSHLPANYDVVYDEKRRRDDIDFFRPIAEDLDFGRETIAMKVGEDHYLISTQQELFSLEEKGRKSIGRLLVAYDMSDFINRQWGYFYLWVVFFACTAGVMFLISYVGFKKYDKIITAQNKKLASRSKQCALGEMIGYIGHQWRQPLNALSMTIQNIELHHGLGRLDDQLLKNQVAAANKNISYLTQVIEDWRALLSSGNSRQKIELADSVDLAINIVRPVLEKTRITVENRIAGPVRTCGFVNDLVQLSVNVILNAKDALAAREGEHVIRISCRKDNGFAIVEFQDNGGGIPRKLLKKVFDAYLTTKDGTAGTGLGLYLCRQIAENLDEGEVWAENRQIEFCGQTYWGACICLRFKIHNEEDNCES